MSFTSVHRNRVIYQSEALFVSPDATGYHYTGVGGYGLSTPPLTNVDPGQGAFPDGRMHGWHPSKAGATQWPEWNPSDPGAGVCTEVATFATFGGPKPVENVETRVAITAQNVGLASNVTLTQVAAGPQANLKDFNTLVNDWNAANPTNQLNAPTAGNLMTLPAGASITLSSGLDPEPIESNSFDIDLVGGGTQAITIKVDTGGRYNFNHTFSGDGASDLATLVEQWNTGLVAGAPAIDTTPFGTPVAPTTVGAVIPVAGDLFTFNNNILYDSNNADVTNVNGFDGVAGSIDDATVIVTNLTAEIELKAQVPGSAGNILLTGDGVSDLDTLVSNWNNTPGRLAREKVDVIETTFPDCGEFIPDDQTPIQLGGGTDPHACNHGSVIQQLKRVQTVNYGFTVNRTDINQFGHLSRLDSIVIEAPTVNLDFSYYLLDGYNERMLEFSTDGITNCLSGALSPELYQAGNNFFLLTVPEARDAAKGDAAIDKDSRVNNEQKSVIGVGNGFLTDYSVDLSVGSIPTVSCTVEGMNIQSEFDQTGLNIPAVDMIDGSKISDAWRPDANGIRQSYDGGCTGLYSLPATKSGYTGCDDVAALRPSDIWIDVEGTSLMSKQISGSADVSQLGTAHIQSASISVPMARTTLQRLGSTFGFSKALDVPVTTTLSISAILSELQEGNLMDLLCGCEETNITISIHDPECAACEMKTGAPAMRFIFKGARLESENFSASIGDNKTVDLSFSVQAGGADDMAKGLYISGKESHDIRPGSRSVANPNGTKNGGVPPAWTGTEGRVNIPVDTQDMNERNKLHEDLGKVVGGFGNNPIVLGYRG